MEQDREAYERMLRLTGGNRTVPVIVEEGKPIRVDGWANDALSSYRSRSSSISARSTW